MQAIFLQLRLRLNLPFDQNKHSDINSKAMFFHVICVKMGHESGSKHKSLLISQKIDTNIEKPATKLKLNTKAKVNSRCTNHPRPCHIFASNIAS